MNDLIVIQASQGLGKYLEKSFGDEGKKKGIVVGFDGRYNSHRWALISALSFAQLGFKVHLFSELVPTPYVAFGVILEGSVGGVMVTASHNPKNDNGYKVYYDNGAQILSPHDSGIAASIEENEVPWKIFQSNMTDDELRQQVNASGLVADPLAHVIEAYNDKITTICLPAEERSPCVKKVYTPMHGVGQKFAALSFEKFGLEPFISVKSQAQPDPEFPTVRFPNPEEGKGALAEAVKTADEEGAKIILANDPDADRFAAAEKLSDGSWRVFNGNELGILLADWALHVYNINNKTRSKKLVVLNTTVSSKMLSSFAKKNDLGYIETLTGFKWLGNKVGELPEDSQCLFAFEEAIGYMVGDHTLDKDGVRTAAAFGQMVDHLSSKGHSCSSHLEELYKKYGYYSINNGYYFCYEPKTLFRIFDRMRLEGKNSPSFSDKLSNPKWSFFGAAGKYTISRIRDLTVAFDSSTDGNVPALPSSSSTQMITFFFDNGAILTLRGSGTEPKLKYYAEMTGKFEDKEALDQELRDLVDAVALEFLQPEANDLVKPSH
eukprot:TRINITY_DN2804_c0_g1_i1.p1 TRINITY_DN2804_c0_g1~~TRINITY_DN2804_c0_g1_i1.p1  ORF type:complete len:625 (+),score=303.52 TRINITY_DN2804_c0_g1_i1:229-1875(+)